MIVVIPVCQKDEKLVLKNLSWLRELDGQIDAHCVLSYPEGFDYIPIETVSRAVFSGDPSLISYPEWGGDTKWPHPQNWAWQSTARTIGASKVFAGYPWLWLEADSTPTKKGWYDAIRTEYERGGKPFMGCITEQINGWEPHMNGVGVYPANIAQFSHDALLCRAAPFDIVIWKDIHQQVHRANHLIQHHCQENGDSTHFPDSASVEAIVNPGVVLFHRCKDGSLIDRLRDPKSVSAVLKSWFPKPKALSRDWPSIRKQTKWRTGFFDLPSHERECHFNCAIVEPTAGELWLVSRRWLRQPPAPWTSDIVRHRLNRDMTIAESHPIALPKQCGPMEQHEDPRIIMRGREFLLSYCSWLLGWHYQAHQAVAQLDSQWRFIGGFHLRYGKNGTFSGDGFGHEKNWTWFYHEGQLYLDYQFSPHIVVMVKSETSFTEYTTDTPMAAHWKHGHIRGGSPPVRVGDEYVCFFHSSMAWRPKQNRYFMGAAAFEAHPPFRVTRITREPLLSGSQDDPNSLGGPACVFPDGALLRGDNFLVTLGVNDQSCAWISIPKGELFAKMV